MGREGGKRWCAEIYGLLRKIFVFATSAAAANMLCLD
jgi:hypothetical protein